jgi:hypothetical protein
MAIKEWMLRLRPICSAGPVNGYGGGDGDE